MTDRSDFLSAAGDAQRSLSSILRGLTSLAEAEERASVLRWRGSPFREPPAHDGEPHVDYIRRVAREHGYAMVALMLEARERESHPRGETRRKEG